MKFLLAPDSFKGSMSSKRVIQHLKSMAMKHFDPVDFVELPIADGGEGTVDILVDICGGEYMYTKVLGPLGKSVNAKYAIINGKTAVIEMAQASGLTLLKKSERNPLVTTTYGTGQIIKAALNEGIREFIIGIGGSATNDGGIGLLQALGGKVADKNGNEVGFGGKELMNICKIETGDIDLRLKDSKLTVICDVSNPLTGFKGATMVYGLQKGAKQEDLELLENGMKNYENVIKTMTGMDMSKVPGAGAAGGLGAAFVAFLNAELRSGINTILELANFEQLLDGVDLVITGEGRIDTQSVYGKVPVGIAERCRKKGVKVVAIAGCMGEGAQMVYEHGIESIMTTVNKEMTIDEALARADELILDAADRMFRFIKLGMSLKLH